MKKILLLGAAVIVVALTPSLMYAQSEDAEVTPLGNKDVIFMVGQKLDTGTIVKTIKTSPCTFDTFPPVLREMKRRGVPDAVLHAMVEAPDGPSAQSISRDDLGEAPIYHYADQLKQMGFITPSTSGRSSSTRQRRTTRSRQRL